MIREKFQIFSVENNMNLLQTRCDLSILHNREAAALLGLLSAESSLSSLTSYILFIRGTRHSTCNSQRQINTREFSQFLPVLINLPFSADTVVSEADFPTSHLSTLKICTYWSDFFFRARVANSFTRFEAFKRSAKMQQHMCISSACTVGLAFCATYVSEYEKNTGNRSTNNLNFNDNFFMHRSVGSDLWS